MDSKKPINVGISSSIIDLKAELLRKQQELKSARSAGHRGGAPRSQTKTDLLRAKSKDLRTNKGVDARSQKDRLQMAEEEKNLEKSKSALEAKAQLYDKMQKAALTLDNDDDDHDSPVNALFAQSLVNFQQKAVDEIQERRTNSESKRKIEEEAGPDESGWVDNDEEWAEFTDALGRTRKCLKTDLPSFLDRDDKLSRPENPGICLSTSADDRLREMKREKWEVEAELLAARDKVHYQDILYDEVRTHGTGYYKFSKDELTREQQMKDLKKLSEQTAASREKILKDKSEKKSQLAARLKKIRDKKRAKAGLPPLPDEPAEVEDVPQDISKEEGDEASDDEKKLTEIRAWDVGKRGVFGPRPTTFDELDEKWLRDRRSDRNPEFAPPTSIYSHGGLRKLHQGAKDSTSSFASFSSMEKYQNFVKSKEPIPATSTSSEAVILEPPPKPFISPGNFWKQRTDRNSQQAFTARQPPQQPVPIQDEMPAPISESSEEFDRGRGVEVAPPPTFEYYHGDSRPKVQRRVPGQSDASFMDAVSSGLKTLREQFESRKSSKSSTKVFPEFL